jgi:type I restriction enzyme S subunit
VSKSHPPGWAIANLFDLCEPRQWRTISTKALTQSGYPVFGANGRIGYYTEYNHEKPTVLITCRGATCGALNISEPYSYVTGNSMALDGIEPDAINLRYLFFALTHRGVADAISGSAQPQITRTNLRVVELPVPPIAEQHRIAQAVDALLERRNRATVRLDRVPTILKRFRQAVLAAACSGQLTQEWRSNQPLAPSSSIRAGTPSNELENADEHLQGVELPDSWARLRMDQLVQIQNGTAFPSKQYQDRGTRLLRPGNLHVSGRVVWTSDNTVCLPESWMKTRPEFVLREGELVMNLTAQSLKDEFLGRVCIKQDVEPALLNQRIARFLPHDNVDDSRPYLIIYLKSPFFRSFVNGLDSGSLIRHMHSKDVARHVVPVPPPAEQDEIVRRVRALLTLAETIEGRLAAALGVTAKVLQSALTKAFTGQLVPTEAELARAGGRRYETGEELLARIRERGAIKDRKSVRPPHRADQHRRRTAPSRA